MLVTHVCPILCNPIATLCNPFATLCQACLSMIYPRQKYWNGFPFSSLGDLLDSGIEPGSPALQADSLPSEPPGKPYKVEVKKRKKQKEQKKMERGRKEKGRMEGKESGGKKEM